MELYSDHDLVPPRGNFNILMGALYRVSLTHDYNFIESNKLWNIFNNDITTELLQFLRFHFYFLHCDSTFEKNIQALLCIHKHGWMEFIIRELNNSVFQ